MSKYSDKIDAIIEAVIEFDQKMQDLHYLKAGKVVSQFVWHLIKAEINPSLIVNNTTIQETQKDLELTKVIESVDAIYVPPTWKKVQVTVKHGLNYIGSWNKAGAKNPEKENRPIMAKATGRRAEVGYIYYVDKDPIKADGGEKWYLIRGMLEPTPTNYGVLNLEFYLDASKVKDLV